MAGQSQPLAALTPAVTRRGTGVGLDLAAVADGGPQYEAVVLAEVWQVFEQLIKEVGAPGPTILSPLPLKMISPLHNLQS